MTNAAEIDRLAQQAWTQTQGEDLVEHYEFDHRVFAELIIRDCAAVAQTLLCPLLDPEQRAQHAHCWDVAAVAAGKAILQRWGLQR